jgi:hypothetical protein
VDIPAIAVYEAADVVLRIAHTVPRRRP